MTARNQRTTMAALIACLALLVAGCATEQPAPEAEEPAGSYPSAEAVESGMEQLEEAAAELTGEVKEKVEQVLTKADEFDGAVDQVVSKCPACAFKMEGSADHQAELAGYSLHFCSDKCKEMFTENTVDSVLAMVFPEKE